MSSKLSVHFIGMSKNCRESLATNIKFLLEFKEKSSFDIQISIIDSDSTDGTKDYLNKLSIKNKINNLLEIDNLQKNHTSRITRLSICRNAALDLLKKDKNKSIIYAPMDTDINLFEYCTIKEFEEIILFFNNNDNIDGMFPFSLPYYYDIFALRKKGWVNDNALLKARLNKNKYRVGSVVFNYLYIYKKQLPPNYFVDDLISVESAFGGMGLYKINLEKLNVSSYRTNPQSTNYTTEHLSFNHQFKKLFIYTKWNIPAPKGYIIWKNLNIFEKFIFIIKTFKNDIKTFWVRENI